MRRQSPVPVDSRSRGSLGSGARRSSRVLADAGVREALGDGRYAVQRFSNGVLVSRCFRVPRRSAGPGSPGAYSNDTKSRDEAWDEKRRRFLEKRRGQTAGELNWLRSMGSLLDCCGGSLYSLRLLAWHQMGFMTFHLMGCMGRLRCTPWWTTRGLSTMPHTQVLRRRVCRSCHRPRRISLPEKWVYPYLPPHPHPRMRYDG
jgi:hypothetical protein